jgi:hypothetical protein
MIKYNNLLNLYTVSLHKLGTGRRPGRSPSPVTAARGRLLREARAACAEPAPEAARHGGAHALAPAEQPGGRLLDQHAGTAPVRVTKAEWP